MKESDKIEIEWIKYLELESNLPSAMSRSSLVVVRSADTVILVFLASAMEKSFLASALGWLLARSPYDSRDLDAMTKESKRK